MNKPTIKYPTAQPTERIGFISFVFFVILIHFKKAKKQLITQMEN